MRSVSSFFSVLIIYRLLRYAAAARAKAPRIAATAAGSGTAPRESCTVVSPEESSARKLSLPSIPACVLRIMSARPKSESSVLKLIKSHYILSAPRVSRYICRSSFVIFMSNVICEAAEDFVTPPFI